jgi:glycosyltransferase involved in cell wall biosynthesis
MAIKILLDARKLGDGGIGVYIENLVDGFLELKTLFNLPYQLTLLVSEKADCKESLGVFCQVGKCIKRWTGKVDFVKDSSPKYSVREYLLMPLRHRNLINKHDVFHSPHYTLPYFIKTPTVATIHDTIHVTCPEKIAHRALSPILIKSASHRADRLITVSESSCQQIVDVFPKATDKIDIIYNCLRHGMEVQPKQEMEENLKVYNLKKGYCLFIGSERPHKGYAELIAAWEKLNKMANAIDVNVPQLVIVGDRFSGEAHRLVSKHKLDSKVKFLGATSGEALQSLLNGAKALVMPSRQEGFGLPVLEAMACGTAVVCTPVPSLKEFSQDVAWVSKGFDPENIALTVMEMLVNDEERAKRIEVGLRRARLFSRRIGGLRTLKTYNKAMKSKGVDYPLEFHLIESLLKSELAAASELRRPHFFNEPQIQGVA